MTENTISRLKRSFVATAFSGRNHCFWPNGPRLELSYFQNLPNNGILHTSQVILTILRVTVSWKDQSRHLKTWLFFKSQDPAILGTTFLEIHHSNREWVHPVELLIGRKLRSTLPHWTLDSCGRQRKFTNINKIKTRIKVIYASRGESRQQSLVTRQDLRGSGSSGIHWAQVVFYQTEQPL